MIYAVIYVNFKTSCLVKEASHKRPHILWFCLYEMSRKSKPVTTDSRIVVAWGLGWEVGTAVGGLVFWGMMEIF